MSVKSFSLKEMLELTGENAATLRNDRRHGQTVAAFGAAEPSNHNGWLLADCAGMLIRDKLNERGMKRKLAAWYVRAFSDHWLEGVSRVEHLDQAILLAVACVGDGRWWAAFGAAEEFLTFLKGLPRPPEQLYTIDLAEVVEHIKKNAKKAGIHLGDFILPPNHPQLIEWTTAFRNARENELAQWFKKPPRGPTERERRAYEDQLCTI
jgi:hypothetical protein